MSSADGSSTRGGSTSVRGRVRSPHISGGRQAAGSQHADRLGSCVTQPRLGQTEGRIAVSLNVPLPRGHNNQSVSQSVSQSINQSINQSNNQSIICLELNKRVKTYMYNKNSSRTARTSTGSCPSKTFTYNIKRPFTHTLRDALC